MKELEAFERLSIFRNNTLILMYHKTAVSFDGRLELVARNSNQSIDMNHRLNAKGTDKKCTEKSRMT
jgi:hypothetical protein